MNFPSRTPLKGLYAIVDPDHCAGRDPVWVAAELVKAGVRTVQLRVKERSAQEVEALAKAIGALKDDVAFTFIVNDFAEVARACNADGVHLGQGDVSVAEARALLGRDRIVGLSTHSLEEVAAANTLPLDYIGFGAIFPTATKGGDHPVPGIVGLSQALARSRHPIIAIGGINREHLPLVRAAGAASYAVLSALTEAEDVRQAAKILLEFARAQC